MGNHAVDISRRYHKAEAGSAETHKIPRGMPVGLCNYTYGITQTFNDPRNYCNAEAGVVDVAVPSYAYKIKLLDTLFKHFLF